MTTALAVRPAATAPVARPQSASVAAPLNFGDLWHMAEQLVPTGMLPDWIKTPGQACAIILAGRELGMEPMRALRSLQMVKGKVSESADSQLARFKTDGGRAVFVELTDARAELHLRHPNGDEHTETFTLDDAKKAGLAGPGSMYQKYPKAMLRSRVITAGLKSIGWEGGSGVYDPAEAAEFSAPTRAAEAGGASAPGEHQYGDEMTLEQALATPLLGGPDKWGGNGGKPLGEIKEKVLRSALSFFEEKLRKQHDDRLAVQAEALALVVAEYDRRAEAEQTKLPIAEPAPVATAQQVNVAPGGAIAPALVPHREDSRTAPLQDTDDGLPF